MEYKILESNGVKNENIDGAAFNNFCADGRNLVIKGILNECNFVNYDTNAIKIDTGELLIQGFRIKIVEPYIYSFSSYPVIETRYEIVAKLTLKKDRSVTFEFIVRTPQTLTQDNLYVNEEGVYEVVFSAFSHHPTFGTTALGRLFKVEKGDDIVRIIDSIPTVDTVGTVGEIVAVVQEAGAERPNEYVSTLFTLITIENGEYIWKHLLNTNDAIYLEEELTKKINEKQDTLVSGESIKTINGNSILGEGDIEIEGGGSVDLENYYTKKETENAIDTKIERVYLEGTTAPTTETVGELGQLYSDTTNGNVYQLKSVVDGVYTWVKLIKETDKATTNTYGISKINNYNGIIDSNGLSISAANKYSFDNRSPYNLDGFNDIGKFPSQTNSRPIVPNTIDYIVKRVLVENKLETALDGKYAWTDEEKATARANLGIGGGKLYLHTLDISNNGVAQYGIIRILSPKSQGGYTYNDIKDLFHNSLYIMESNYCLIDESGDWSKNIGYNVKFGFVNEKSTSGNAPSMLLYIDDEYYSESGEPIDFEKGFTRVNFNDLFADYGADDVVYNYTITEWTSF